MSSALPQKGPAQKRVQANRVCKKRDYFSSLLENRLAFKSLLRGIYKLRLDIFEISIPTPTNFYGDLRVIH